MRDRPGSARSTTIRKAGIQRTRKPLLKLPLFALTVSAEPGSASGLRRKSQPTTGTPPSGCRAARVCTRSQDQSASLGPKLAVEVGERRGERPLDHLLAALVGARPDVVEPVAVGQRRRHLAKGVGAARLEQAERSPGPQRAGVVGEHQLAQVARERLEQRRLGAAAVAAVPAAQPAPPAGGGRVPRAARRAAPGSGGLPARLTSSSWIAASEATSWRSWPLEPGGDPVGAERLGERPSRCAAPGASGRPGCWR